MEDSCVVLNTFSDDELADANFAASAATDSPKLSDRARGDLQGEEEEDRTENRWELGTRERAISSRLAESSGGMSSSNLGKSRSGQTISRLVQKVGEKEDRSATKRKGIEGPRVGLPRTLRQKIEMKLIDATDGIDATTVSATGTEEVLRRRAPSEELSDSTAKPATPDPSIAAATAEMPRGSSSVEQSLDTAAAIKGVLEGLALDGSMGDDNVDVPDGLLSVPLLRHQRRALSWMKQREAPGSSPCGGLLADDQGLGKTFSAIALIATNRPSSCPLRGASDTSSASGRPMGGTLVVCPMSVLRQWERELALKVSKASELKVLVHHGVGRTKSAVELAKYDVVLTTFAVVGIEVAAPGRCEVGSNGIGDVANTNVEQQQHSERQVGLDEPVALEGTNTCGTRNAERAVSTGSFRGAVGGVDWFRVVLDEAQSIKNSRSQVAMAVSAVSAQRRWCLSGTPLQNNVDDLFSYFRFLRYEPYCEPGAFRTIVKEPIRLDPTVGFRRLQAILQVVMLRRTKQTQIGGVPIVKLPPRTVIHSQRHFLPAEAKGYARLQAEYRSKMEEFAAAGTVSSNYVNLLHMLLRLRQACNHPSLVGSSGCSSSGVGDEDENIVGFSTARCIVGSGDKVTTAAVSAARRLPAALRGMMRAAAENGRCVCGICGDPPHDVAVASCCTRTFCKECISPHVSISGAVKQAPADLASDGFFCPSCGTMLMQTHIHAASALVAADMGGTSEGASRKSGGALKAGGRKGVTKGGVRSNASAGKCGTGRSMVDERNTSAAALELRTLMAGTKVQGIMEYLTALKARHQSALAAVKTKAKARSAVTPVAAAVAKGTQLRRGIRSSDAALAAALPPLTPVSAPGYRTAPARSAVPSCEKAIVFSQWTAMLDLLEPCLKSAGIHFRRLDGTMSLPARERALAEFEEKPDVTVILMSLKAAGLGVNLTCANHVILSDVWWNPTVEEQAIDRAHRIGQMREVKVVRFTVKGTVEDRILALQDRKRAMVAAAFGEDNEGCVQRTQLTLEDLVFLFGSSTGGLSTGTAAGALASPGDGSDDNSGFARGMDGIATSGDYSGAAYCGGSGSETLHDAATTEVVEIE